MTRVFYLVGVLLAIAPGMPNVAVAQGITLPEERCPRDSVVRATEDGLTFEGVPARRYVESFLSGDPSDISRVRTGTSAVDVSMIARLSDAIEMDRGVCTRLNYLLSNGQSGIASRRWVYFRAGSFYFAARWTEPRVPSGGLRTGYNAVMVFDQNLNLLGAWTA